MGRKNKKIRKVEVVAKKEGTDLYYYSPPPIVGGGFRLWTNLIRVFIGLGIDMKAKKIVLNYLVDRGLLHSEEYEYIFAVIGCNKWVIKGVLD